jgi:hypothetical protein
MSDKLDLLAGAERLAECKAEERRAIERQALREKQRAQEAVRRLTRPRRIPGICHELGYWMEFARADRCVKDAIRAHLFARGNSPIQTFGSVLIRAAAQARAA